MNNNLLSNFCFCLINIYLDTDLLNYILFIYFYETTVFQPLSGPFLNFSPRTHTTLIRPWSDHMIEINHINDRRCWQEPRWLVAQR